MHPLLNTAIKAVRLAARVILMHLNHLDRIEIYSKGRSDFVTQVDREAEAAILDVLMKAYPDHGVLAEESGARSGNDYTWYIDPLDGTTNFIHGYPQFGISLALEHRGRIEHSVVFDPLRDELFTASRGEGARLNDRRIRVSSTQHLDHALLGTGFPVRTIEKIDPWLKTFRALLLKSSGIRRAGAAALDLAHVAAGRFDGFWEMGLKPWDMAAGTLLIREAGGLVADFDGGQEFLKSGNIVAANSVLFNELLLVVHGRSR
jgi:myo-inositol-1(or 4)-monophosphatase